MQQSTWRVTHCSVQGASHIKSNDPCQDYSEWRECDSILLAAVADGAGSASESLKGATTACKAALDELEKGIRKFGNGSDEDWKKIISDAFARAREAVFTEAETLQKPARELACTLIVLAASPERAVAGQIGDGAALVANGTGELLNLTRPAETEYLNQTTFLTGDEALGSIQVSCFTGPVRSIAMFTDGLQMLALKMPDAKPHQPFFAPLLKFMAAEQDSARRVEQLQKFLTSPKLTQRADDDLTLLLATRPGEV
jgi:hypothetical protein